MLTVLCVQSLLLAVKPFLLSVKTLLLTFKPFLLSLEHLLLTYYMSLLLCSALFVVLPLLLTFLCRLLYSRMTTSGVRTVCWTSSRRGQTASRS